jgi:hypothetical protein
MYKWAKAHKVASEVVSDSDEVEFDKIVPPENVMRQRGNERLPYKPTPMNDDKCLRLLQVKQLPGR